MRRFFFWFGWAMLAIIPIAYTAEILVKEDLPAVQPWKWVLLFGVVALIYFTRNRDEVLKHHVL